MSDSGDRTVAFRPSHYLVRVEDLATAVEDFETAGFSVVWGGDPSTAHNALISFASGGFIELFEVDLKGVRGLALGGLARAGAALGHPLMTRFHRFATARGLCDFALETSADLDQAVKALRQRGGRPGKIRDFSRVQVDGTETRWQLCTAHSADLPFVMGPYDPPRLVDPSDLVHGNGITRLCGLRIENPKPERYGEELGVMLGCGELAPTGRGARLRLDEFDFVIEQGPRHDCRALLVPEGAVLEGELHGLKIEVRTPPRS